MKITAVDVNSEALEKVIKEAGVVCPGCMNAAFVRATEVTRERYDGIEHVAGQLIGVILGTASAIFAIEHGSEEIRQRLVSIVRSTLTAIEGMQARELTIDEIPEVPPPTETRH